MANVNSETELTEAKETEQTLLVHKNEESELDKIVDRYTIYKDDDEFGPKFVVCGRYAFKCGLVWLAILMLSWDIIVPYGVYKTIAWKPSIDNVYACDVPEPRPYEDTVVWFNQGFRQEFGIYWTVLITGHVLMAWVVFPSFFTQLIGTCVRPHHTLGDYFHKTLGITIGITLMILWSCGGTAAVILIGYRGFHPCAMGMDYDCRLGGDCSCQGPPLRGTSFSFYLYLQFVYDGALISDTLLHGMASRLLIGYRENYKNMELWYLKVMNFLSYSCIWLYILRTGLMTGIIITYYSNPSAFASDKLPCIQPLLDDNIPAEAELKDYYTSVNIPGPAICVIMLVIFWSEIFVIPWINIGNILFTSKVFKRHKNNQDIPVSWWKYSHGANLYACGFAVLWTFLANIGFRFWTPVTIISYILLLIGLLLGWYIPVWKGQRPHSEFDVYFLCCRKCHCCKETTLDERVKKYIKDHHMKSQTNVDL